MDKIIQMCPNNFQNYKAVLNTDKGKKYADIVCWALVEDDECGSTDVRPLMLQLDGEISLADDFADFGGYHDTRGKRKQGKRHE